MMVGELEQKYEELDRLEDFLSREGLTAFGITPIHLEAIPERTCLRVNN